MENILPEMDSSHNLLVVAHQAVIRCLFSFFFRTPAERMPYDKIPLHTLMKITWDSASGKNNIEMQSFGIEAVDTHRPKADSKADQAKSPAKTPSPTKRSFHQSLESTGDKMIA